MNPKSKTCFGKKTGKPLTAYRSAMEAQQAAGYENDVGGNTLGFVPYKCGTCDKWHLSPGNRQTPSVSCDYCGKGLYETKKAAQLRADILRKEQEVKLSVYSCPNSSGWHLTRRVDRI